MASYAENVSIWWCHHESDVSFEKKQTGSNEDIRKWSFCQHWSLLSGYFCPRELLVQRSHMAKMLSAAKRIYRMTDLLTNDMLTMISFGIGVGRFFQNANIIKKFKEVEKKVPWHDNAPTGICELPVLLFQTGCGVALLLLLFFSFFNHSLRYFCLLIPLVHPSSK